MSPLEEIRAAVERAKVEMRVSDGGPFVLDPSTEAARQWAPKLAEAALELAEAMNGIDRHEHFVHDESGFSKICIACKVLASVAEKVKR